MSGSRAHGWRAQPGADAGDTGRHESSRNTQEDRVPVRQASHIHETPGDGAERKAHERGDERQADQPYAGDGRELQRQRLRGRERGQNRRVSVRGVHEGCCQHQRRSKHEHDRSVAAAAPDDHSEHRSGKQHAAEDHAGKDPGDRRSDPGGPFLSSPVFRHEDVAAHAGDFVARDVDVDSRFSLRKRDRRVGERERPVRPGFQLRRSRGNLARLSGRCIEVKSRFQGPSSDFSRGNLIERCAGSLLGQRVHQLLNRTTSIDERRPTPPRDRPDRLRRSPPARASATLADSWRRAPDDALHPPYARRTRAARRRRCRRAEEDAIAARAKRHAPRPPVGPAPAPARA